MTDAGEVRCLFCGNQMDRFEGEVMFETRVPFYFCTVDECKSTAEIPVEKIKDLWGWKRIADLEAALQKIHDRIDGGIVDSEPFYIAKEALKGA